ncbi:HNH endonuclease [Ralstonia insidiosa]|uniref:HNH endonuclease n=2 Tax=Ralstonia insidiosa TaxID=190721 RepID=A0A848NU49_9RALS|nr:HNH endonuclease [Ralstonia insidiosa]
MNRRPWSEVELTLLGMHYADSKTADIARALDRSITTVYQKAAMLGLKKSESYLAGGGGRFDGEIGSGTRFFRGQTPWNKGVKGSTGTHPNSRRTQFRKGEMHGAAQHNYLAIGSERINADGYLERKITDDHPVPARRWVAVHRLVWEAANGPIPCGHVVCFLPGRKTSVREHITIDILELVSRGELAQRNHPRSHHPELAKLVQLKGAITRQVNRIAREAKEKQP